ncbi:MAG: ABC transporter ATP-binding protein [Deltaproteobacteria bacterium]|nr:ABC transporter ATP-binding protein [Deltaproteobacteria bacterium]
MLKVDNLVKDFATGFLRKKVRVLKGVSFSVNKGEIFGFVGPNGAGKTTTFKAVLGFVPITDGSVELMGKPLGDVDVKKHVGYLPENPYFYDYLTGEELLRYMGQLHGLNGKGLSAKIDELLEKVKMSHARKVQLRKYSKGMLQRVGVAQALINDPDFLILDEPMTGLDPIGQREIKDLILEEKKKGKTILLSSHMLSDVEALCDRVGVIMSGRVVKTGELGKLLEEIHTDYEMLLKYVDERIISNLSDLKISVEKRAGFLVLRFDEDIKERIFQVVSDSGADIVSLHPLRKSLEGLFVEEAKKDIHIES